MDNLLKQAIKKSLVKKGYLFTENATSAGYTVTYTAALKSALSDDEVLRIYGAQPLANLNKIPLKDRKQRVDQFVDFLLADLH